MISKLTKGKIPAYTECPFVKQCGDDQCVHKGESHTVEFSCGFARAFDSIYKAQNKESKNEVSKTSR